MSTKYDHIVLGRAFRPVVLRELKAMPDWPAYLNSTPYAGRSQDMTNQAVKDACGALELNLDALWARFQTSPVTIDAAALSDMNANAEGNAHMENADMTTTTADDAANLDHANAGFEGADAETIIAELLAPASAHMTPHLANMLPGLIRPAIEAAVRGPRTVTVTTREYIDANGVVVTPAAPAIPLVNVVKRGALGGAFGVRKSDCPTAYKHALENIVVNVCDYADAPAIDPDYSWNLSALAEIAAQDTAGLNAWVYGPAGTGKTEGVKQYAARLRRPFVRIAIERTTEPAELIGQEMPAKGGGMVWTDGKLTRAFRIPHCVILIDEPTLLRSGSLAVIMTALDMREIYLPTGETVKAAQGVFVVAADNTAGTGDDTGRYVDTAPLNAAFLDRFAFKTPFEFLPVGQETTMLAARTGLPVQAAKIMVEYAAVTRSNADSGKLTMGVTTRRLLAWARTVRAGINSAKAFQSAIVTGAAPEDREALMGLATASLTSQHALIDGMTRGTIDPNAPPDAVKAQGGVSANALAFPDDDATA